LHVPVVSAAVCLAAAAAAGLIDAPEGKTSPGRTEPPRCSLEMGGKVQVKLDIPESIASGDTVALRGTVTLNEDAASLTLQATGDGPVVVGPLSLPSGPHFTGDVIPFETTAVFGDAAQASVPGKASVAVTATTVDDTGKAQSFKRATLYVLLKDGSSWAGLGGFLPLEIQSQRAYAAKHPMTSVQMEEAMAALVRLERSSPTPELTAAINTTTDDPMMQGLNALVGAPREGYARLSDGGPLGTTGSGGAGTSGTAGPAPSGSGSITIQGHVTWQDENGTRHPVFGGNVQIWDDDTGPDEFIDTAVTDTNGNYSITVNNDDGFLQGDRDVYAKFVTKNSFVDTHVHGGSTYEVDSATHDETPDGTTITEDFIFDSGGNNDSLSVFQAATWIASYVAFDAEGSALPQVGIDWPNGDDHSFYDGEVNIEQPDRYDWDTVHHEFGHYVMDQLNIDDNPGGTHNIGDCISDVHGDDKSEGNRLAWGEGWPTYFGTSGQFEMNMGALGVPRVGDAQYDDLEDGSVSYGMDTQDNNGRGEDNEVAVQRLLWDLYDSNSDGRDSISRSDNSIWNAIKGAAGSPQILSHYWQALRSGQSDPDQILMGEIAADQQIGAQLIAPVGGAVVHPSGNLNFSWKAMVGCPSSYTADLFQLRFYDASTKAPIFTVSGLTSPSHALTLGELGSISSTTHSVLWGVESGHTPSPSTGPYLGETFAITVNRPPVADAGTDIVAECTSPTTTPVQLNGTGSSDPDGDTLSYSWSAPGVSFDDSHSATPTGQFPIATKTTTLTVSDGIEEDTDTVDVTVHDTTAPVIHCPGDIVVECSASGGTPASDPQLDPFFNGVSATDVCDTTPTISSNAPPFFNLGVTTVTFTAVDDSTNSSNCQAKVTVQDTTPPDISVELTPEMLWPPNHTMHTIEATISVSDVCDPNPTVILYSISSSEPDNGLGDGDTANDIQGAAVGTDDREFDLRAERSGKGLGRTYAVVYQAQDGSGNTSQELDGVKVPHKSPVFDTARRKLGGAPGGTGVSPVTGGGNAGTATRTGTVKTPKTKARAGAKEKGSQR
jgi:hypothetical protein